MYKKIIIGIILASVLAFGGCKNSQNEDSSYPEEASGKVSISSDGTWTYKSDESLVSVDEGSLIGHSGDKIEVSAPEGSISFEEACNILDGCSFEKFYLPQKVSEYEKYYYGTVNHNGTMYYSIGFYIGKNATKIYAGTNVIVSCDGKKVMKQNWTGSYESVEKGSASEDKSFEELYPGAEITPEEALFVLEEKGSEALGLSESIFQYTFETNTELKTIKSIKCYKIVPKLIYEHSTKLFETIYVTADGTNRVIVKDKNNPEEYIEVK